MSKNNLARLASLAALLLLSITVYGQQVNVVQTDALTVSATSTYSSDYNAELISRPHTINMLN
jgi:hypothetical protein